jgi:hypothetical protein
LWRRLPDERVTGNASGQAIEKEADYFRVRLVTMYLGKSRRLWRKRYAVLHSFVSYAGREDHTVAGPGQLIELGDRGIDRVVVRNLALCPPTPYRGGDVALLAGLYAVPGDDAAAAFVSAMSGLASFAGIAPAAATAQVVSLVKDGVDKMLGLGSVELRLGVRDTFFPGNPLRAGFHVGIGAPEPDVPVNRLWLADGRLLSGADPVVGKEYAERDYFVVQVERMTHRHDWAALPGLDEHNVRLQAALRKWVRDSEEAKRQANAAWPEFEEALKQSVYLTRRDADVIAAHVHADIANRLDALDNMVAFRDLGGTETDPTVFDFADVSVSGSTTQPPTAQLAPF